VADTYPTASGLTFNRETLKHFTLRVCSKWHTGSSFSLVEITIPRVNTHLYKQIKSIRSPPADSSLGL